MKKVLIISAVFIVFFISNSFAETYVSGDQWGTWDVSGSPYILNGNVTIPDGNTLSISPGITVQSGSYHISVYGQMDASNATISCPVHIENGGIINSSSCNFGNIYLKDGSSGTISDGSLNYLYMYGTAAGSISGNTIILILFDSGYSDGSSISGNMITDGAPLRIYDPDIQLTNVSGNTYSYSNPQIQLKGTLDASRTLNSIDGLSEFYLVNNVIVGNGLVWTISPGITVQSGSYHISVYGQMDASNATISCPVHIENGGIINSSSCNFGNIYLKDGSSGTIKYSIVNRLTLNSNSSVYIINNDFSSVYVYAEGDSLSTICLEHNWWGTTDPALIENKITHHVDDSGRPWVDFDPWRTVNASGPTGTPPEPDYHNGNQEDKTGFSNDPVNMATGNFFHSETDMSISTRSAQIEFTRHYNSKDAKFSSLGLGWTHSYNIYLTENSGLVKVQWGDGRADYWDEVATEIYEPNTVDLYDRLEKVSDDWIITRGNLDKYTFDPNGLLTQIADKNGNVITLNYSHPVYSSLVTEITDPAGRSVSLEYYADGTLQRVTDFAVPNRTMEFSYTGGYLTQVTDVMGESINYAYDMNGYFESITDQRGITTVANVYDANGRVIQQTNGNGNITLFAYDTPSAGQTTQTDPNGNDTIYTHFTDYNLLRSVENPLGSIIYYNYDESGNRTEITDRNGNATFFEYDSRSNVIETTAADGGKTIVEYNDVNFPDLPTKKTDALGNIITWEYDSKGNVVRQVDPNDFERTWTYNSFGQKVTETDENSHITSLVSSKFTKSLKLCK